MPAVAELLLLCDLRGTVIEASGPLAEDLAPRGLVAGASLASWISEPGSAPALDFLLALRGEGAAFGHRLPLAGGVPPSLAFAGLIAGEHAWILACQGESRLWEACRELLAAAGELPFRPAWEACERLHRLAASAGGEWQPAATSAAPPAVGSSGVASAGLEAAVASRRAERASLRELLEVIRRAGLALFRGPLSGDQARLAAAVTRKSEALAARFAAAGPGAEGGEAGAEEVARTIGWESLLREGVALHQALEAERQIRIELELRGPLPFSPSRGDGDGDGDGDAGARELWLDLLLAALVDSVAPGGAVRITADPSSDGGGGLRLVAELVRTELAAGGDRVGSRFDATRSMARGLGGSLRVTRVNGGLKIVAELPA